MSEPTTPPNDPGQPGLPPSGEPSYPTPPPADPYGQGAGQPGYAQPDYQQGYAQQGYAQQGYQGYPQSRPNNTMAIVSLISGIVGLTVIPFIGSIVAVITGHMARKQIAETGEEGGGLATGGLITGWIGVGLGVLGILAVILFFGVFAASMGTTTWNS